MKIGLALQGLYRAESDLADELLRLSEQYREEHDIHHLARDLAGWSQRHVREIAETAKEYGVTLELEPLGEFDTARTVRKKGGHLLDPRGEAALRLLDDLRAVYVKASGVSLDWVLLGQAARGIKDSELLTVVARCHPDTLRQVRWANAMLKELSPQILTS